MSFNWRRALAGSGLFTPGGLLLRAGILVVAYLVMHAVGLREYTTVLSGTAVAGQKLNASDTAIAVTYAGAYFGFVLAVPIMILAAAIFAGARHWAGGLSRNRQQIPTGTTEATEQQQH